MNRQFIGWTIVSVCLSWGIIRALNLAEANFVLNFFAIGGFCFGVYLTKDPNDEKN